MLANKRSEPPTTTASGLPWVMRLDDERAAYAIASAHGIPELVARIIAARGVTQEQAADYLNPTLRASLPDPSHLKAMDEAVGRVMLAIANKETIAVFGDYDVDGATSSALLTRYFRDLGITIRNYIPDRMKEGYGPTIAAFDTLIDEGASLIITVDCGTLAFQPIAHAKGRGVDVVVLDHHTAESRLPDALTVNPNRLDDDSTHGTLAAVGVTFLFLVALNRKLRANGYFRSPPEGEPESQRRSGGGYPSTHTDHARDMRKEPTPWEATLWHRIRDNQLGGYKFRRQQPIGRYIVDFVNSEKGVIVELDGSQHQQQTERDAERDAFLRGQGYQMIRVWNNALDEDIGAVLEGILAMLEAAPHRIASGSATPPQGGSEKSEPDLLSLLDIVALGTVADVVPLKGLNRVLVTQGLKVMAKRANPGLSALMDVSRLDEPPNTFHCGYLLGPRINAGGRVGEAGMGMRLLTTDDTLEAQDLAQRLDRYNEERRAIETSVLEQAMQLAEAQANLPVMLLAGVGWHPGVIGIVAARIKEKWQRPAAIVALEHGIGKASARTVGGADIGAAVHAAVAQGLIVAGGGHAMAAGFTAREDQLEALHSFLCDRLGAAVTDYAAGRRIKLDGWITASGATLELIDLIERAGPYGAGNPSPRFGIRDALIVDKQVMKEKHLRLVLADPGSKGRLTAVAFHVEGTTLGQALVGRNKLHLAGELKRNRWQGRESVQFLIDDAAWD